VLGNSSGRVWMFTDRGCQTRLSFLNVARMGLFPSDRVVVQYPRT
jgi:glucan phosphorylase